MVIFTKVSFIIFLFLGIFFDFGVFAAENGFMPSASLEQEQVVQDWSFRSSNSSFSRGRFGSSNDSSAAEVDSPNRNDPLSNEYTAVNSLDVSTPKSGTSDSAGGGEPEPPNPRHRANPISIMLHFSDGRDPIGIRGLMPGNTVFALYKRVAEVLGKEIGGVRSSEHFFLMFEQFQLTSMEEINLEGRDSCYGMMLEGDRFEGGLDSGLDSGGRCSSGGCGYGDRAGRSDTSSDEPVEAAFILFDYQHEAELLKRYIGKDGKLDLIVTMKMVMEEEKKQEIGDRFDAGRFLFEDKKTTLEASAMMTNVVYHHVKRLQTEQGVLTEAISKLQDLQQKISQQAILQQVILQEQIAEKTYHDTNDGDVLEELTNHFSGTLKLIEQFSSVISITSGADAPSTHFQSLKERASSSASSTHVVEDVLLPSRIAQERNNQNGEDVTSVGTGGTAGTPTSEVVVSSSFEDYSITGSNFLRHDEEEADETKKSINQNHLKILKTQIVQTVNSLTQLRGNLDTLIKLWERFSKSFGYTFLIWGDLREDILKFKGLCLLDLLKTEVTMGVGMGLNSIFIREELESLEKALGCYTAIIQDSKYGMLNKKLVVVGDDLAGDVAEDVEEDVEEDLEEDVSEGEGEEDVGEGDLEDTI